MRHTKSCVGGGVGGEGCTVAHGDGQDFGKQGFSDVEQSLLHWSVSRVVIKADFKVTVRGLCPSSYHDLYIVVLDLEYWSNTWSANCLPLPPKTSPCPPCFLLGHCSPLSHEDATNGVD